MDSETGALATVARKLDLPEGVRPYVYRWHVTAPSRLIHLAAVPAFFPRSSPGAAWLLAFGIYLGHDRHQRLLSPPAHAQGLRHAQMVEHLLAMIAVLQSGRDAGRLLAAHRHHHQHIRPSARSALASSIFSGATSWLFVENLHGTRH